MQRGRDASANDLRRDAVPIHSIELLIMGMTLLEAAKYSQDPLTVAVIRTIAEGPIMGALAFRDVPGAGLFYNQEGILPNVGFRGINEAHGKSYGVLNPQSEALRPFGGDIDVDRFIVDTQGPDARAGQTLQQVRAARKGFEDLFINGSSAIDPRQMDGLKARITSSTSQYFGGTAGALSLSTLDQVIGEVESDGAQKYLVMNKRLAQRFIQASRNTTITGFVPHAEDAQGRRVAMYGEAIILETDVNGQNQKIQPFTEGSEVVATVSNVALASNVATLTISSGHGILVGNTIKIAGTTNNSGLFNGTYTVTAVTATSVSYARTNADVTSAAAAGNGRVSVVTGATSSIYCVAFGDQLCTGIQGAIDGQFGPRVRDLGEVHDAPVLRTRMDWNVGMAVLNGRSVARYAGITDAAIVA